ncbi:MAG TPA: transglycosylase SLT domain-containing protein, partial [Eoetvoesiella sp.]
MLIKQQQRYQKTQNLSGLKGGRLWGAGAWLALTMGLSGCAGAEAPVPAPTLADPANLKKSLTPSDTPAPGFIPIAPQAPAEASIKPVSLVPPSVARQALIDAREAMQKKQWTRLAGLVPQAQAEPQLGSYAEYWYLRQQVQDPTVPVPTARLQQFMSTNQDDYLADKIKADWIVAAGRAGDYAMVNQLGPVVSSNANVDCTLIMAQHMTGQRPASKNVMDAFKPTSACWGMLDQLAESKVVGWKQLEPLLRATLEENKTGNAQRLAAIMFNNLEMVSYAALMKDPQKWLSTQKAPKTRADIELVTLALARLARTKNRLASAAYIENNWANAIPKSHIQWVWGQFGLIAALNVEAAEAVNWYRRSGNAPMTDYNNAWQVRSELRQAKIDWSRVSKAIQKMSPAQQAEPVWVYWYARSLAAQGNKEAANKHFASITGGFDFYGQLATEELGQTLSIPKAPAPVTAAELAQARAHSGLQRAIMLFDLGWRPEAVPEWNFSLRGMNDRQLLAAAELARHEQIFDRVVNTSLRTQNEIDFTQRFIAPFEGRVTEKARLINLDPAWVYGLIRQESRFITDARSHVGASGLMQLMPATARWVARKIGMKDFTPS